MLAREHRPEESRMRGSLSYGTPHDQLQIQLQAISFLDDRSRTLKSTVRIRRPATRKAQRPPRAVLSALRGYKLCPT